MGGFEYPDNDDASQIDSEKVTLGQRKNQLSRRLRLAKKQNGNDNNALHQGYANSGGSVSNGSQNEADQAKRTTRSAFGARALQMKRDGDLTLDESDFVSADEEQNKRPRMAKNHPDFAPLIVPPASFRGAGSFDAGSLSHQTSYGSSLHVQNPSNMDTSTYSASGNMMGPLGGSALTSGPFFQPHFTSAFSGQQPQQPRASAVAVSSLTSTAQAVGLTLEQLALALSSNTTNLAKLVAETKSGESMAKQEELALNLYETESKSLYTKCMLMSGIDMSLAQPGAPTYAAFALKAWQAEGKRLQELMSGAKSLARLENTGFDASDLDLLDTDGQSMITNLKNDAEDTENAGEKNQGNDTSSRQSSRQEHHHDHEHGDVQDDGTCREHEKANCDAQHVHRLGQCGHKAIIHQPKGGTAHIDFIVNDQVECYMGLESVPFGRTLDSTWPSKYKCKDVEEPCFKTCGKNYLDVVNASASAGGSEPKILKLSDINLEDPEWNYDGGDSVDGGVMGLFKLCGDGSV
jgi:hypothetical protein